MKKKYSVHRRETHYVTFDVFFDVEAENPKDAVAIAEKHWKPGHSTDSFVSDHSSADDSICSTTYVEGDTLAVTDKEGGHWGEGEWEEDTDETANKSKSYILVLTVGGQFVDPVHTFTSRELAEANAPILIANAKKQGYTNQFGDYYLDDEDYSYYIREAKIDAPVIPEEADDEEEAA